MKIISTAAFFVGLLANAATAATASAVELTSSNYETMTDLVYHAKLLTHLKDPPPVTPTEL